VRCHAGIAATYAETGMSQSFHRIGSVAPVEDFVHRNTLYNQASDRHYIMIEKSENFFEQRFQIGFQEKQTNREEMQIDYVVGSGDHARTFLHRTPEGKLIELPVSWYSERGGIWEMSPGYDDPHQQDFLRAIPYGCVSCHNAYPSLDSTVKTDPDGNVFPADLPEGIDCQRCHGPGEAHVEVAEGGGSREAIRASIVNPARLSRDRQMDLCMQCHLETTSWPLPHSMRRLEHPPFSYQPGRPLEDYELNFDHEAGTGYDDNFEVVHQAYRLRKSACFQKSQMTCLTCHDPHQQLTGEAATQHYIAVCLRCHAQVHAAGIPGASKSPPASAAAATPNCLTCHMWERRTEDAVHVVMTDHDIQRYKPKTDMLATPPHGEGYYRGAVVAYYPESLDHVPDGALYLDVAQVEDDSNLEAGAERLRRDIAQSKPDAPEFCYALGTAYSKLGKPQEAIPWYQEALRQRPGYQQAMRAMAGSLEAAGDLAQAAKAGETAAAEFPPDTATLTDLGSVYLKQGRLEDAKRVSRQALALDPNLPHAEVYLGLASMREGDTVSAESFYRQAIAITPDMSEPHNDLAILLVGRGNYAEAAYELAKASAADPANAQIHRNYGAVLARLGMPKEAEGEFRQAVRLAPSLAQPHVDLGNLLAKSGDSTQAEGEFRSALALDPQDGMAHLGLARLLAQKGAVKEAREHYEAAAKSADPTVRQAAQDALPKSAP
jgi:predicted CXXCH cytochrome family protein